MASFSTTDGCIQCGEAVNPRKRNNRLTTRPRVSKKINQQLLNYLYHQNVRESIIGGERNNGDRNSCPKLTFVFSAGSSCSASQIPNNETVEKVCNNCIKELEKLEKLNEELESIKRKIDSQVKEINVRNRRKLLAMDKQANNNALSFQTSLACSVTGKDDVTAALRFLDTICAGITNFTPPTRSGDNETYNSSCPIIMPESTPNVEEASISFVEEPSDILHVPESFSIKTESDAEAVDTLVKIDTYQETDIQENFYPSVPAVAEHEELTLDQTETPNSFSLSTTQQDPLAIVEDEETPVVVTIQLVSCSYCGKKMRKQSLKSHEMIHTGERPFECGICKSRFSRKTSLVEHTNSHTGERPFQCGICRRRFRQRSSRAQHRRKHHKNEQHCKKLKDKKRERNAM